ncbi:hypothetical protein NDU88_006915 [Pleurodeles waltl]|uniref:Uncharacterized protein n=1 Tax=Pleurodeles waltl TaxID=8319 RepID=A0AAV7TYK0_PLEWA|nr:hypothetical protein NDU88_006915 [Pleurodeles waltl]
MGKNRSKKGAQQTRMDQYTAQRAGESLQKASRPTDKGGKPTGAQILAAIEASGQVVQKQIATMTVDVNLLRADLWVMAERLVATEQQVTCIQTDTDMLKATVAILEAKTRKLEGQAEDAEGRARRCKLQVVGFLEGAEGKAPEAFLEEWVIKTMPICECDNAGDLYQNGAFVTQEKAETFFGIDHGQLLQYTSLSRMA